MNSMNKKKQFSHRLFKYKCYVCCLSMPMEVNATERYLSIHYFL